MRLVCTFLYESSFERAYNRSLGMRSICSNADPSSSTAPATQLLHGTASADVATTLKLKAAKARTYMMETELQYAISALEALCNITIA